MPESARSLSERLKRLRFTLQDGGVPDEMPELDEAIALAESVEGKQLRLDDAPEVPEGVEDGQPF